MPQRPDELWAADITYVPTQKKRRIRTIRNTDRQVSCRDADRSGAGTGAAHLFALPNKIGLDSARYFTVQGIYRGWSMFGFMLLGALVANLGLALLLRRRPVPFALALTGFLLIATTLAVFFIWVYPANQATANWTTAPEDWERLRRLWECGHAAMPR